MWAQLANTLLGLWLIVAPAVLGYGDPARVNDRIVGPLAASFAYIALHQITRPLRWVNLPLGAWLLAAPWVLGHGSVPTVNSLVVGLLLILFSLVRGNMTQRYGGGWAALWSRAAPAAGRPSAADGATRRSGE